MMQRKSNEVYKQAKYDCKRKLFVWLCEIKVLLKDAAKMSQRDALDPEEVPILGAVPKRCPCKPVPFAPVGPPCPTIVPACLGAERKLRLQAAESFVGPCVVA